MTSMTEEQMRILFDRIREHRKQAFFRTDYYEDDSMGTCILIHHKSFVVDCRFFFLDEDRWDLTITLELKDGINDISKPKTFKKPSEEIFEYLDKMLDTLVKMPNYVQLLTKEWNRLFK